MAKISKELFLRNGSGYWWYRFTNPLTSKQVRGSTKTCNKQEAQKILDLAKSHARFQMDKCQRLEETKRYWIEIIIHSEQPKDLFRK